MKTVLFYSFKGGVGRTQLLLNMAKYLAESKGKKIAIVDFDLYAPGLSYMAKFRDEKKGRQYLIDYLINLFRNEEHELYFENLTKNIVLIPAINPTNIDMYFTKVHEFSQYTYGIKSSAEKRQLEQNTLADQLSEYITRTIKKIDDFDYIFYDARTGMTEVSDILFSNDIDLKIMISSFNKQNIDGMEGMLELLSLQKGRKHKIIRVLSPKPMSNPAACKDVEFKASLVSKLALRDKFDWIKTLSVPYEEEVVHNDFEVWEKLKSESDNKYIKAVKAISDTLVDALDNDNLEIHAILQGSKK